ncbi:glycosyltransferase [Aeromonas hydrophila]|uniref:glycosyltransferase n=1 Tax=Aeromonas hydrophila TaxID=644 RepID=UPI00164F6DBA|nr:glycosyltransferase [Aeromonas hydrophila]
MIGLYCNWKVKPCKNGFYINAIHAKYLMMFRHKYGDVLLLSNTTPSNIDETDIFIENGCGISLLPIPFFSSYIGALKHSIKIVKAMKGLFDNCSHIYVRTPEPLSWLFGVFNYKNTRSINYHFTSNPLQVLLCNNSIGWMRRYLKLLVFLPEYLFTCLAAKYNKCSANGDSMLSYLPFYMDKNKVSIHIESTLSEADLNNNDSSDVSTRDWSDVATLNFLCVSRLQSAKGIDILLNAIFEIKKSVPELDIKLRIVGDGPLSSFYEKMIEQLSISDIVQMVGHVKNGPDLDAIYKCSHVLINPSLSETGPRVLLEAMNLSVLCLSTDVGYAKKVLLEDPVCGLVIKKNSLEELINSILWICQNRCDAEILAKCGKPKSKLYSLDRFVGSIFKEYSK